MEHGILMYIRTCCGPHTTHMQTHAHTCTHTHTYVHLHMHTHTHTHTHTHKHSVSVRCTIFENIILLTRQEKKMLNHPHVYLLAISSVLYFLPSVTFQLNVQFSFCSSVWLCCGSSGVFSQCTRKNTLHQFLLQSQSHSEVEKSKCWVIFMLMSSTLEFHVHDFLICRGTWWSFPHAEKMIPVKSYNDFSMPLVK